MIITALDFETCNRLPGSICAVGMAMYADGVETETLSGLIRPHPDIFCRSWEFEWIHGIARNDVLHSPEFPQIMTAIRTMIARSDIVACHNAPFDISQLRAVLRRYRLDMPRFDYICTCRAARKACPGLPNYKLSTVAGHYRFSFRHHDALDDARAAGYIMCQMTGGMPLPQWADRHRIAIHSFAL